jgi:glycerophosphoryl diester phosphodiesterase
MTIPQLVAHRGYPLHYPENTLVGIEAAIRAGARYVEVDVQLTADQVPVLFHDRTLERICGVAGAVHDYPFERLAEFRASEFGRFGYKFAQERIATLGGFAGLLGRHPEVTAFVELKRASLDRFGVPTVLERVRRDLQAVDGQYVLISYDMAALAAARTPQGPPLGAVVDRWGERHHGPVRAVRPEYLFCDVAGLPRLGRLRYPGARIAIYEVADAGTALTLAARGADLIETFAVGELRRALELAAGA